MSLTKSITVVVNDQADVKKLKAQLNASGYNTIEHKTGASPSRFSFLSKRPKQEKTMMINVIVGNPNVNKYQTAEEALFLKDGANLQKVLMKTIRRVEYKKMTTYIYTSLKTYTLKRNLNTILPKLQAYNFVRLNRNEAAAMAAISKIDLKKNLVYVDNTMIKLSRTYKDDLFNRLLILKKK